MEETKLVKSSGSTEIDKQAEEALRSIKPLPLPSNYSLPTIESVLTYNVVKYYLETTGEDRRKQIESFLKSVPNWSNQVGKLTQNAWGSVEDIQENKRIAISITFDPVTGQIFHQSLLESSCDKTLDKAALNAIQKLGNLPVPDLSHYPANVPQDLMIIAIELLAYHNHFTK